MRRGEAREGEAYVWKEWSTVVYEGFLPYRRCRCSHYGEGKEAGWVEMHGW